MAEYDPITVARFWSKVHVTKGTDECWLWHGAERRGGYGGMKIKGRVVRSNRIAWELFHGEPLGDRQALHRCDNPKCCNPKHIYAGTNLENQRDMHTRIGRSIDKLTPTDVADIKAIAASGSATQKEMADFYGVTPQTIRRVVSGVRWSYVDAPHDHANQGER